MNINKLIKIQPIAGTSFQYLTLIYYCRKIAALYMTSDFVFLANNWFQYLPTYVAFILNLHILNTEFK